jgi:hypothetical protein
MQALQERASVIAQQQPQQQQRCYSNIHVEQLVKDAAARSVAPLAGAAVSGPAVSSSTSVGLSRGSRICRTTARVCC